MVNVPITINLKLTPEAHHAFKHCSFNEYLVEEIVEQMYDAFRSVCFNRDVSEHIISLARDFDLQALEIMEDMKRETV